MSYTAPSTLVYQQLSNSGGASTATPDLNAVIVGPAYNVLTYTPGSVASLVSTAAIGTLATTGTISANSNQLTVANIAGFAVDEPILVSGAGASGATLLATVTAITGNVFTLSTAASVSVTGAAVTTQGIIGNNLVVTTLSIPGQIPGQIIDPTSVQVWLNNATVQTFSTGITGAPGSNTLTVTNPTTTGSITTATSVLTVSSSVGLYVGDQITIAGAGAAGATLTATIVSVSGTNITINAAASTTVSNAAVAKVPPSNLNTLTSTLNVVPGAAISIGYVDASSTAQTFTTTVLSVVTTSGQNGNVTEILTSDILPTSFVTQGMVMVDQMFNNQLLPAVDPVTGTATYTTTNLTTNNQISINPEVHVGYGLVVRANVNIAYTAQRVDLANQLLTFHSIADVEGVLGVISPSNPLALALQTALANTTTAVYGMAVASNDLVGHEAALAVLETQTVYALVPLTQDPTIISAYQVHCDTLSTPQNAAWRVVIANTAIPTTENIGIYTPTVVNSNGGNNAITLVSGKYVLTASNATFISDGVVPGDNVVVTSVSTGNAGTYQVQTVLSNQQLIISATSTATAVSYYVSRSLTASQSAVLVAQTASGMNDNRVWFVQPDQCQVPVNGVATTVPGYHLCAAVAGAVAGQPVQQGFTNLALAGITQLIHSNTFFKKADLDTMAAAGVCLVVQKNLASAPYIRHALTTNPTVLQYREQLMVKNWDFLSYYYKGLLDPFVGSWNITPDTLQTVQQTVVSGSNFLISQKLPRIGSPLLGFKNLTVSQETTNTDRVQINMNISIVNPLNYFDFYLII